MTIFADDGATSIAAGGLVARRETRIVMAKEVLSITTAKIVVDYDFRNDTAEDVTTEVAFPVPPYEFGPDLHNISAASFQSFKLWIDGKRATYEVEPKATLKGKDVSAILRANKVDIATCGHFRPADSGNTRMDSSRDFDRLAPSKKSMLIKQGLFQDGASRDCQWTASLNYFWKQTFPAHSVVRIRHEYSPVIGFDQVAAESFDSLLNIRHSTESSDQISTKQDSEESASVRGFCPTNTMLQELSQSFHHQDQVEKFNHPDSFGFIGWVQSIDFILTTANTWQRPIEDFTLIIERPKVERGERKLVSLCAPGKIEKLDADHFQLHLINFIPKDELHIGFFGVPAKLAQRAMTAAPNK